MMGQFLELSYDANALQSAISKEMKKFSKAINSTEVKNMAAEEYKDAIEKYVPKKTGNLRDSARVSDGKIVYSAKSKRGRKYAYASEQYRTPRPEAVRHTPNTYDHWDKHLTRIERITLYSKLAKEIAEVLNGRQK